MKHNYLGEMIISLTLIILTILLLNPFHFWMPNQLHMLMIAGLVIAFIFFSVFIWKEKSADEREQMHKASAGRWAYLIGSAVLVVGIVIQSLNHTLDPWLIIALVGMVFAKIAGFIYSERNN